jgi:hypothetical protein
MNNPEKSWQKLVAAARSAPKPGDEAAPFGFSTRVAALAFEQRDATASIFARFSVRAAAVACALAIAAVAINFSAITSAFDTDTAAAAGDDPIAEVVNLGT